MLTTLTEHSVALTESSFIVVVNDAENSLNLPKVITDDVLPSLGRDFETCHIVLNNGGTGEFPNTYNKLDGVIYHYQSEVDSSLINEQERAVTESQMKAGNPPHALVIVNAVTATELAEDKYKFVEWIAAHGRHIHMTLIVCLEGGPFDSKASVTLGLPRQLREDLDYIVSPSFEPNPMVLYKLAKKK